MQMSDIATGIAHEAADSDSPQIAEILIMVIGSIIIQLIRAFSHDSENELEAAKSFLDYYGNAGIVCRLRIAWKIRRELRKNQIKGFSSIKMATAMVGKFHDLTASDVVELSRQDRK